MHHFQGKGSQPVTAGVMLRVNPLEPCLPMKCGPLIESVVKIRFFGFEVSGDGQQCPSP